MTKKSNRLWIDYLISSTPYPWLYELRRNAPFQEIISNIFIHLSRTFCDLVNLDKAIHIFFNRNKNLKECHFLSIQNLENHEYQSLSSNLSADEFKWLWKCLSGYNYDSIPLNSAIPQIRQLDQSILLKLFDIFGEKNSDIDGYKGLIISFDQEIINLGNFLFWGKTIRKQLSSDSNRHLIELAASSWYRALSDKFSFDYNIKKNTYLPSYRKSRWGKAAIIFADIRNFTALTEMIRYIHDVPEVSKIDILREILKEYIAEMSKIVQDECNGRISRYLGDGLMAVFGEYSISPPEQVGNALKAASLMVKKFNKELKSKILEKVFGGDQEFEFNEWIDINLGVGIDFGKVLFDYLGDEKHLEYSTVGVHVNFSNHLTTEAARYDEKKEDLRAPILISQAAERWIRPWLKTDRPNEIMLHIRGKAYPSKVFELDENIFDVAKYDSDQKLDKLDHVWNEENNI